MLTISIKVKAIAGDDSIYTYCILVPILVCTSIVAEGPHAQSIRCASLNYIMHDWVEMPYKLPLFSCNDFINCHEGMIKNQPRQRTDMPTGKKVSVVYHTRRRTLLGAGNS